MPAAVGHKNESEICDLYEAFFKKAKEHLKEDGIIIMYSHNKEFVKRMAPRMGYRIRKEFEISMREGSYVYVIER